MTSRAPLVSVVTPSFNQAPYIRATIDSVLSQDYEAIEYIVMDGNSTDGTQDALRSYGDRLRWVSEPDRGQADAINRGFVRTSGEIIAWLNSDDTYEPGAVRAAATYLAEHPDVALVYGNANFIDAAGKFITRCAHVEPPNPHRLVHYSDYIVQPAAFFRRSAFQSVGGLDASLNWTMDYDLWLKLSERFKLAHIPQTLANYRWFGENKTAVGAWKRLAEIEHVARRYGAAGLPAYVTLEKVNLLLGERKPIAAAKTVLSSPRAMLSLLSPRTWKIIYTGQILRARAAAVPTSQPA